MDWKIGISKLLIVTATFPSLNFKLSWQTEYFKRLSLGGFYCDFFMKYNNPTTTINNNNKLCFSFRCVGDFTYF